MKKQCLLRVGDIIELKEGHEVYADIPERFVYPNKKESNVLTHHNIKIKNDFSNFKGKYIVYKTKYYGGGTGHGPNDIYPDGYHVFCKKIDDDSVKVDFYQTGCFTAMIEDIMPIGNDNIEDETKKEIIKTQDKKFDELVEEATIKIHAALLDGGSKAMKTEIHTQLSNARLWTVLRK